MIISEKQIFKLLHIAEIYKANLKNFGEHDQVEMIQDFLNVITNQQSEELKEIK